MQLSSTFPKILLKAIALYTIHRIYYSMTNNQLHNGPYIVAYVVDTLNVKTSDKYNNSRIMCPFNIQSYTNT